MGDLTSALDTEVVGGLKTSLFAGPESIGRGRAKGRLLEGSSLEDDATSKKALKLQNGGSIWGEHIYIYIYIHIHTLVAASHPLNLLAF